MGLILLSDKSNFSSGDNYLEHGRILRNQVTQWVEYHYGRSSNSYLLQIEENQQVTRVKYISGIDIVC